MWYEKCVHGYLKCGRHAQVYQKCYMRHVHKVTRNMILDVCWVMRIVTWDMCTGLSEMWYETCVHGYQKCGRLVLRVIINVTWGMCTGLSEMWHEASVRGYQKCNMRHVHRVTRNVTWDLCKVIRNVTWGIYAGLAEMWHESSAQGYHKFNRRRAQGYQKCDTYVQGYQKCYMKHVYRVIRNVTWDMSTALSEIPKHNEQSTLLSVAVV